MPVVRKVDKGDLERALLATNTSAAREAALVGLVEDVYATASRKPRDALLKTWVKLRVSWFGEDGEPPFPLDEVKLVRVSALFKIGGYRSFKNYLSRAKDRHLQLGYTWNEALSRVAQKCSRSVLRGLGGMSRSEAFDIRAVVEALRDQVGALAVNGPRRPLPAIVCAAFFMLRELEASSIDRSDVVFGNTEVTLSLPVSKTGWEAKGCKRTWACVCDRNLPCPFHLLLEHCNELDRLGGLPSDPLFSDEDGNYCAKAGMVDTIRTAASLTGMQVQDGEGNFTRFESLVLGSCLRLGWGRSRFSCLAVAYLAEAPLMSLNRRLKPLESQRLQSVTRLSPEGFSELDGRVRAIEMFQQDRTDRDNIRATEKQIEKLKNQVEDHSDQLEGLALVVDESHSTQIKKVISARSGVEHQAVFNPVASPHTWRTKCGWGYSGKLYAESYDGSASLIHTYRTCPKCCSHSCPDDDSESSSSTED